MASGSQSLRLGERHSGFNVFCGPRIQPGDGQARENLARYIICDSFSQERMTYIREESKVIYKSKDGKQEKVFDALEWLAAMCSHVPDKGESFDLEAFRPRAFRPRATRHERLDLSSPKVSPKVSSTCLKAEALSTGPPDFTHGPPARIPGL